MPTGAGLSLASGAGGTQHLCILKLGILGKISPRIAVSLQKVELEGNGEARRELLPGAGSRGGLEGRLLHSGAVGCLKERVGWRERGKRGWRKVKGTPKEERGSAH